MKKMKRYLSLFLTILMMCNVWLIPVEAGVSDLKTNVVNNDGVLNEAEWYSTDPNIACEAQHLVIPADSSTEDTKLVSKLEAKVSEVSTIVSADADFKLTSLPKDKQFVLGFGFSSIEPMMGETGNVEIIFTNENGIKVSVIAYGEDGAETLVDKKACGSSVGQSIAFDASISNESVLTVKINQKTICEAELPVDGTGRFGILQTGACGAEFDTLIVTYSTYEKPENKNIDEDFEDGEFDATALFSKNIKNNSKGVYPAGLKIEDYKDGKVLRLRNTGLACIGTKYQYSNFEMSFDIPYLQGSNEYDENGNLISFATSAPAVSFGEQTSNPRGESYISATDLVRFTSILADSWNEKAFSVSYDEVGYGSIVEDVKENIGFSVKLTMVDSVLTVQIKPLSSGSFKTLVTHKYENYQAGNIFIWSTADSNYAIDNLKITNLDTNANLSETEYESSVIVKEDYVLTEEETTLVFRETTEVEETKQPDMEVLYFLCCVGGAVVFGVITLLVVVNSKRKQKGQGEGNEKK